MFPLLCPVAEEMWVPGWKTNEIFSKSGLVELDCIFTTPSDTAESIWIVTYHNPKEFRVEMYKITPNHTVGKLEILLANGEGNSTKAIISYEFTSIGDEGEKFLNEFTPEWYSNFMIGWEKAMNYYLEMGKLMSS